MVIMVGLVGPRFGLRLQVRERSANRLIDPLPIRVPASTCIEGTRRRSVPTFFTCAGLAPRSAGRYGLTRIAGPATVRGGMSSKPPEAPAPTLAEAVRCPLLEERQEEWIACCTARFLPLAGG